MHQNRILKGICSQFGNKTCDSCPRCVEEDEYFPENQSSQPVTRSTHTIGKPDSGLKHLEAGPCIRCAAKKDILLSLPYETYYERMDNSGKTVVHAGVCNADNRNSCLPVLEGC